MNIAPPKIAIVKPDHFGDLVLSRAAIRAVLASYPDAAVFVASRNLPLARFLFGRPATCAKSTCRTWPNMGRDGKPPASTCWPTIWCCSCAMTAR